MLTALPLGPAADQTLDYGPNHHTMDFPNFSTIFEYLALPPIAATVLAVACTFAIGQLWAATTSTLVAVGLAWADHPWLCAAVAASITAAWLIDCARYPKRDCLRCKGAGGRKRAFWCFTTVRRCRRCDGAGSRPRLGARILTRAFGDRFG